MDESCPSRSDFPECDSIESLLKLQAPVLDAALRGRLVYEAGVAAGRRRRRPTAWIASTCILGLIAALLGLANLLNRGPDEAPHRAATVVEDGTRGSERNADSVRDFSGRNDLEPIVPRDENVTRVGDWWLTSGSDSEARGDGDASLPNSFSHDAHPRVLTPSDSLADDLFEKDAI